MILKEVTYFYQGYIYVIKNTVQRLNGEMLLQFKVNVVYFNIF